MSFLAADSHSDTVLARSPMERAARAAGARFERRDGWNVAVSFDGDERERERIERTVGFADCSWLTKLEVHGTHELSPGRASRVDDAWWCPVTPARALVLGPPSLRESVADEQRTVIDLTCGLAALSLAGPWCRELLARICALDVRPSVASVGSFRPGSVARTPGYLLVADEQRLLIMVGWALGDYLWQVVADAARHLGGGPVGIAAIGGPAAVAATGPEVARA